MDFQSNQHPMLQHPFMIDMILLELFDFVDYPTLQSCRLVCTKWKKLSEQVFLKRSMICFSNNSQKPRHPTQLKELFYDHHPFPIKSYQFKNDAWSVEILEDFCKQRTRNVHDLRLVNVALLYTKCITRMNDYDISSLIFPQLKKLVLDCREARGCTMFTVSLDSLVRVDDLHLHQCHVNIPKTPTRIGPKKIKFSKLFYIRGADEVRTLLLNEIVDFGKVEDVYIDKSIGRTLMIDLGREKAKIQSLYLDDIDCVHSRQCNWDVKKLTLKDTSYTNKNQVANITELNLWPSGRHLDFTLLPSTLRKLSVSDNYLPHESLLVYPKLHRVLPQLECLDLRSSLIQTFLPMFTDCDKLVDIELHCYEKRDLDVNFIPRTVKNLKLVGRINVSGEGLRSLNNITVDFREFGSAQSLATTLTKLVAKKICVALIDSVWPLQIVRKLTDWEYVIGECIWEGVDELEQSEFLDYVDTQANYYYFKYNKGKAITKQEYSCYATRQ